MSSKIICRAYFSPHGTTKKIMDRLVKKFQGIQLICDFMKDAENGEVHLTGDDVLLIGLPVFAGRIPSVCRKQLQGFHGKQTPAIIYVTYGNRDYEDALLELKNIITACGFRVIAAAAFVCEHSIFPEAAQGHPTDDDLQKVTEFANIANMIYHHLSDKYTATLELPGRYPYRKADKIPFTPSVNDACTNCGRCAEICPVQAISKKHPQKTKRWKCISCTACIYACPFHARGFYSKNYQTSKEAFITKHKEIKQSEIFF